VYDPWIDQEEAHRLYGVTMVGRLPEDRYDAVILAVAHREFTELTVEDLHRMCKPAAVIYDVKNILPPEAVDGCL
jgi:UDP-N-acetyl-D-galactosamine dehydrogenase